MPGSKAKTNEVAVRDDGSLEPDDFADVLEMIRRGERIHLLETEQDNEALAAEILERTLGATTAEELFSSGDLTAGGDFVGVPFQLRSVRFRNSDEQFIGEGALGIYAILEGVTRSGEMVAISSSAKNVIVKSIMALRLGALPRWVKVTEDKTKKGYDVQNLVGVAAPKLDVNDAGEPF